MGCSIVRMCDISLWGKCRTLRGGGVFLKDPCSYLQEFRRKSQKLRLAQSLNATGIEPGTSGLPVQRPVAFSHRQCALDLVVDYSRARRLWGGRIALHEGLSRILACIYTSFGENYGKFRTARQVRPVIEPSISRLPVSRADPLSHWCAGFLC